jgi:murein DD-endopeptidase MepM/ murein hydrolase activator NlpD
MTRLLTSLSRVPRLDCARARRRAAAILVVLIASTLITPVQAQETIDEAKARREAIQQEAAVLAVEIDELSAEDADIVAALDEIDSWVAVQQSRLERARQDLSVTGEVEDEANQRAADLATHIADLEQLVADQLVQSYIGGFRNDDELILASDDINQVPLLRFALDESTGASVDTTDLLRAATREQAAAIAQAEQATLEGEALEADIEDQIVELDKSRLAQERIRAEVTARITELEETTETLESEDREIADFIRAEQERIQREEEERKRREAEEERLRTEEARRATEQAAEAERLRSEEAQAEEERLRTEGEAETQDTEDDSDAEPDDDGQSGDGEEANEPEPRPDSSGAPNFRAPVNASISSGFGYRIHPIYGTRRLHTGLDYNARNGSAIASAAAGTVIFVGTFSGYGNTVMVEHGGGYTTLYAHMSGFNTSEGASVRRGDTVGFVGSTGLSTGPHLHFEIRLNGTTIDPLPLL